MQKTNEAEVRAEIYLRHLGHTDIEPQPEGPGGKFPDFLVDQRIGVEVRRLNINDIEPSSGKLMSIEQSVHGLACYMGKVLKSFGPPLTGVSWTVDFHFEQPIDWKKDGLERKVKGALKHFQANAKPGTTTIPIAI